MADAECPDRLMRARGGVAILRSCTWGVGRLGRCRKGRLGWPGVLWYTE